MKTARQFSKHFFSLWSVTIFLVSILATEKVNAQRRNGNPEHAVRPERLPGVRSPEIRQATINPRTEARNNSRPGINRNQAPVALDRIPRTTQMQNNSRPVQADRNNRMYSNNSPADVQRTSNSRGGNNLNNARPSNNNKPSYGTLNRPAYRPVYGYNPQPVYNSRNPSWRYGYLPRRNSYFYGLPGSYFSINFGGIGYRYWSGVFYRPHNNLFMVIAPPVGIFINVLPSGYRKINVRNYPYYYYNGTYYDQRGNNYFVISPPVGAIVESLPAGFETLVIDGETFYTADGAQYKPIVQENGEIWYEVIKAN